MAPLSQLQVPRGLLRKLERHGISDTEELLALNERELMALPGFGWGSLGLLYTGLGDAGLRLAEDPYAPYICAREGKSARDANLANFFLCEDCAGRWEAEAFDGAAPEYEGPVLAGFCLNCNLVRDDIRLRQWILCGNCERVACSIGRSVVAERFVADRWNEMSTAEAHGLTIESTDVPSLRRGPRGASGPKQATIDFVIRDPEGRALFGFEMKTGRAHVSGTAPVGPRIGEFQLDTSDCDDIATVIERDELPVYLLHVQVIDRVHPPTLQYVALAAWWADVFRMSECFDRVQRRPRETRNAAYFDTTMFAPFETFAEHVANGGYEQIAKRIEREGMPALYQP